MTLPVRSFRAQTSFKGEDWIILITLPRKPVVGEAVRFPNGNHCSVCEVDDVSGIVLNSMNTQDPVKRSYIPAPVFSLPVLRVERD